MWISAEILVNILSGARDAAPARLFHRASILRGDSREAVQLSVRARAEMDGVERKRTESQRMMKDSDLNRDSGIPERVTLKKEIGLLSACTIIIGKGSLQLVFFLTAGRSATTCELIKT